MLLRPCPFCAKSIPRAITVCPYCHRDEQGQSVQIDSAAAVVENSPKAFEQDMTDLASEDPYTKDQAMVRLAHRGYGVVQGLIAVLSDLGKPGLAGVAKALGRIGDKRALPALIQAARMGDEEVRMASVWAIAQFHDAEVVPPLLAEAERPDPLLQAYTAFALGSFRDARALPLLTRLLKHSHREVAFHAACALGEAGDAKAVPALQKALSSADPVVRAAASASLRRFGASTAAPKTIIVYVVIAILVAIALGAGLWHFTH